MHEEKRFRQGQDLIKLLQRLGLLNYSRPLQNWTGRKSKRASPVPGQKKEGGHRKGKRQGKTPSQFCRGSTKAKKTKRSRQTIHKKKRGRAALPRGSPLSRTQTRFASVQKSKLRVYKVPAETHETAVEIAFFFPKNPSIPLGRRGLFILAPETNKNQKKQGRKVTPLQVKGYKALEFLGWEGRK